MFALGAGVVAIDGAGATGVVEGGTLTSATFAAIGAFLGTEAFVKTFLGRLTGAMITPLLKAFGKN